MLNKYLELLQHATEVMTSVGKSGAGAANIFRLLGMSFLSSDLDFCILQELFC